MLQSPSIIDITVTAEQQSSTKQLITALVHGCDISPIKHDTAVNVLLLCHHTFTQSETVLNMLLDIVRHHNSMENAVSIRTRVSQMCSRWIEHYWKEDFMDNDDTMLMMRTLIYSLQNRCTGWGDIKCGCGCGRTGHEQRLKPSEYERLFDKEIANRLGFGYVDNIEKHVQLSRYVPATIKQLISIYIDYDLYGDITSIRLLKKVFEARQSAIGLTPQVDTNEQITDDMCMEYDIMTTNSNDIAEQITLIHFNMFKQITKREMITLTGLPLVQMANQFGSISRWVICTVLQQRNKAKRTECIETFIHVAVHLTEQRNFSAGAAVQNGLSSTVIYRLKDACHAVSKEDRNLFREVKTKYGNWTAVRALYNHGLAPSVLHVGMLLYDLSTANVANREDDMVCFGTLHPLFEMIEGVCIHQQSSWYSDITTNVMIQCHLRNIWEKQQSYNDEKLGRISSIVSTADETGQDIDVSELFEIE
eukprot:25870_1